MRKNTILFPVLLFFITSCGTGNKKSVQNLPAEVSPEKMQAIYEEIKTPYKFGLIMVPPDPSKKVDCPSVFRKDDLWYMTYLVFDGRGYETWLAVSKDLFAWDPIGPMMSFSDSLDWDDDQKAGYVSLQDTEWEGSYEWESYDNRYWMSYIGGSNKGYEAGMLSIGIAWSEEDPTEGDEWQRLGNPVLSPADEEVRWWENSTMYKSSVIRDRDELTGYPFVMYFNARGDSLNPARGAERIGMAVSDDMIHWERYLEDPVLNHHKGITGDGVVQKIDDVWVMFYFGAFWEGRSDAFNRFACSYDLVHWTDWEGDDLIASSEPYDEIYAHKSSVVKHDGIVYHFYCAVNNQRDRGIALATSVDLGKSDVEFNSAEK